MKRLEKEDDTNAKYILIKGSIKVRSELESWLNILVNNLYYKEKKMIPMQNVF